MMQFDVTEGVLASSLQVLPTFDLIGIVVALVLGGMAKGSPASACR